MSVRRYFHLLHQWCILRLKGCTVKKRGWLLVIDGGKRGTRLSLGPQLKQRKFVGQSHSLKAQ